MAIRGHKRKSTPGKDDILYMILNYDSDDDKYDELLQMLLQNPRARAAQDGDSMGERVSDIVAGFVGSWKFIIGFISVLVLWMFVNIVFLANQGFDPYPFILLNLVLSCVSAIQAPLIMMSQNRQDRKDRQNALYAYESNLKTEVVIKDLHEKINKLVRRLDEKQ